MDVYTLGKLALPFVIAIMAVAAVLTMAMGIFTTLKTLTGVQHFFRSLEENRSSSVTINILSGGEDSQPPMQEQG
jgi:hypothetical protein